MDASCCCSITDTNAEEAGDDSAETKLLEAVRSWATASDDHRFVSLFVGDPTDERARDLSKSLAKAAGDGGVFLDNLDDLIGGLIRVCLERAPASVAAVTPLRP